MINLSIKVNSVDQTSRVQATSLQITSNLNQRRDSCSFIVKKTPEQTFYPQINDEVEVFDGTTKIFGGVILTVEQSIKVLDLVEYKVSCSDYSHFLDRELVVQRYESMTINDIIADLLANYAPTFTALNVVGDTVISSASFNRITLSTSIQRLADQVGFLWYVDYDKDIHFFPKNTEPAPFSLTDTSNNFVWDSLDIKRDLSQLRNAVYVQGGEAVGLTRTETFIAVADDEERKLTRLANKFATKPTVVVTHGGSPTTMTVGIDYLDDDGSFDCMWNFNEKYIRFTGLSAEPHHNDTIEVTGDPLFPIIVRVQSSISIDQFGVYEFAITDKSIRSRDEAKARGFTELRAYQNGLIEGKFETYTAGLRSGQVITINSPIRDINESFMIQSVSFRMPTIDSGKWTVTLATLRTVGIIDFLRGLLKTDDITINEAETLLSFYQFADEATASDSMTLPSATFEPPYIWLSDDPGDDATIIAGSGGRPPIRWNFFSWTS